MSALPPDLPLPPFGDNLGRFGNDPDGLARKWSQKPTKPWGDFHKSEPLLFASCTTLILGPILGLSAALACLFIPPIFCIPVIILAVIAVVVACGHVLSRLWFPADKPPGASPTSVPNDVPWEKSKEVLSKFLAEEVKSPEEGKTDEDANPTKAALKKHLKDPNEDGARMGVFLLTDPNAAPGKICQFFEVVAELEEPRRTAVLMAIAKVEVPGFDTGQYESMGAFAMTHADSGVRQGYLDLLNGLGAENLLKVLQQPVYWPGFPEGRTALGMFIVSRELPTEERLQYIGVLSPKLGVARLWDIKMDDGWTLPWSLLLFGDKVPEGKDVRDRIKTLHLSNKEGFEELMAHRPGGFSKANETTHANDAGRNQLNDRMEVMRNAMNDYLRTVAAEYGVAYQDIEWTS